MSHQILLTGSQKEVVEVIETLLEREGYSVTVVLFDQPVLSSCRNCVADLVVIEAISDIQTAHRLIAELRLNLPRIGIITIAFSGASPSGLTHAQQALALGADRAICKPFVVLDFFQQVKEVLHQRAPDQRLVDSIFPKQ